MADTTDNRDFPAKFYDEINNVIGGSNPNEKLILLLPGIALTKSDFAYDYKNSEPKGPVIEANESRLANKLYDFAELVGSDNGKTLEHQYKSALDTLTPKLNPILANTKNELRDLLMKPFPYKFGPKNIKRAEIWEGGELKIPPQEESKQTQFDETEETTFQEVFFHLYNDYVEQLGEWANERQRRKEYYQILADKKNFKTEAEKNKWRENQYLQWYEDNGEAWLASVNQKMSVLLSVFSDNDMKIIEGILDSGSGAELQEARQTLRNCRKINPDGGYIYPVKFNPTNWFEYLDSSFTPVDLVNSPAAIMNQLKLLNKNKSFYDQRILDLTSQINISDKELKKARQEIKAAKSEFEACDSELQVAVQEGFTDFAKFAATTICEIYCPADDLVKEVEKGIGGELPAGNVMESLKQLKDSKKNQTSITKYIEAHDDSPLKTNIKKITTADDDKNAKNPLQQSVEMLEESQKDPTAASKTKISDVIKNDQTGQKFSSLDIPTIVKDGLDLLVEGTNRVNLAQHVYLTSIDKYTDALLNNSEVKANNENLRNELVTLKMQKESIESEIQDLKERLRAVKPKDIKKCFSDAVNPPVVPEGFTEVSISHTVKSGESSTLTTSSSSTSTVDSGFWIFRKSTRTSESQSATQSSLQNSSFTIEIGMNVAKVEIEREWFNPGVFALTEEMYSVAQTNDNKKVSIAEYKDVKIKEKTIRVPNGTGIFPCFPTALVIARDVSIRLTLATNSSFAQQSEFSSECSSAGTFFVFNSGDGSSSHVSSGVSKTNSSDRAITLRFTTPQIIGFYQQIVPEDKSALYPSDSGSTDPDKSVEDTIVKFIKAYEKVIEERTPKQKKDVTKQENILVQ